MRHAVVDGQFLCLHEVDVLGQLVAFLVQLVLVHLLGLLELDVLLTELLFSTQDVLQLTELVLIVVLDSLEELVILLHDVDFVLNFVRFFLINLKLLPLLSDLGFKLLDTSVLSGSQFFVFFLAHFLLLEESRELDQVLLDHDVFLSEFGLLQFETFLFATTIVR